jgi:hypothetical protein
MMFRELNNLILNSAPQHEVRDVAPSTFQDLLASTGLVIWSGESDHTIFGDARVNWAFRALHDSLHLKIQLDFSPRAEIELGRIQANQYSGLMADLVYIETAGQAEHYLKTGRFVLNQVEFTISEFRKIGYKL